MSLEQRDSEAFDQSELGRLAEHFEAMSEREDRKRWDVVLMVVGVLLWFAFLGAAVWWAL